MHEMTSPPKTVHKQFQKEFFYNTYMYHRNEFTGKLSIYDFCVGYNNESWRIGPFKKEEELTFKKKEQWKDPLSIGWKSSSIYNPSIIHYGSGLAMAYRASPKKESLASRIGIAFYTQEHGWKDFVDNPIIFSTGIYESLGCEDPKLYVKDGVYYLFYQAVWEASEEYKGKINKTSKFSLDNGATSTMLAVSNDLKAWDKLGMVVPLEVSKGWSKGAVIPKNEFGEPVKINGKYIMYVSEGCGGKLHIGYSDNLIAWDFEKKEYLKLPYPECNIEEVACASIGADSDGRSIILDFYYQSPDKIARAGQALYSMDDPFKQLDVRMDGGTLSWGGMIRYKGKWLFAQGWDAKEGTEEMYFYSAEVNQFDLNR